MNQQQLEQMRRELLNLSEALLAGDPGCSSWTRAMQEAKAKVAKDILRIIRATPIERPKTYQIE